MEETRLSLKTLVKLSKEEKLENDTEEFWKEILKEEGINQEIDLGYKECAILLVQLEECIALIPSLNYVEDPSNPHYKSFSSLFEKLLSFRRHFKGSLLLSDLYKRKYKELFCFIVDSIPYIIAETDFIYDLLIEELIKNNDIEWLRELFSRIKKEDEMHYWSYISIVINSQSCDEIVDLITREMEKDNLIKETYRFFRRNVPITLESEIVKKFTIFDKLLKSKEPKEIKEKPKEINRFEKTGCFNIKYVPEKKGRDYVMRIELDNFIHEKTKKDLGI